MLLANQSKKQPPLLPVFQIVNCFHRQLKSVSSQIVTVDCWAHLAKVLADAIPQLEPNATATLANMFQSSMTDMQYLFNEKACEHATDTYLQQKLCSGVFQNVMKCPTASDSLICSKEIVC